jgi:hypothetical protein
LSLVSIVILRLSREDVSCERIRRRQLTTGCDFYIWVTLEEGESEPETKVDADRCPVLSFSSIFLIMFIC